MHCEVGPVHTMHRASSHFEHLFICFLLWKWKVLGREVGMLKVFGHILGDPFGLASMNRCVFISTSGWYLTLAFSFWTER